MRVFLISALAFVAVPAVAQDTDAKSKNDPNKVICRTEELIGSRLQKQRTCLTRQQWAQRRDEQKRTLQRIQDFKPNNGS